MRCYICDYEEKTTNDYGPEYKNAKVVIHKNYNKPCCSVCNDYVAEALMDWIEEDLDKRQ